MAGNNNKVMVTDADGRTALAFIRSLGSKGFKVTAVSSAAFCSGFLSRYCAVRKICPSPETAPAAFLDFLINEIRNEKYDLIIPASEFTAILASKNKPLIEQYARVAVPSFDLLNKTLDKSETFRLAGEAGIPCPATFTPKNEEDVRTMASGLNYPVVIKPRSKSTMTSRGFFTQKVTPDNYVGTPGELVDRYHKIISAVPELAEECNLPLLQEYIEGEGFGFESICDNGTPRAIFMHRRIREYPITGGASTYRESVFHREMQEYSERILKLIQWHGPSMVEFKLDRKDNVFKLIEINGRLWGSLPLSLAAGVDFPLLIFRLYAEQTSPAKLNTYDTGVRSHWTMPGELLWLLAKLRAGDFEGMGGFFLSAFNLRDDVASLSDPLPFLGAIAESFRLAGDVLTNKRSLTGELASSKE